jgi:Ser/Thr protein kinase RdoA (MazF antagonist)
VQSGYLRAIGDIGAPPGEAEGIATGDRDFLQARCADLTAQFGHLEFALPRGPIHGDAHTKNLLTDHGQMVLIDFEAAAIGPREWDLLSTSIAVRDCRQGDTKARKRA